MTHKHDGTTTVQQELPPAQLPHPGWRAISSPPRIPFIYLCGPYSNGGSSPTRTRRENLVRALREADHILSMGLCPVVPHLTHYWHRYAPRDYSSWMSYCIALLSRCDILYRYTGVSVGANLEVLFAFDHSIPVIYTREDLLYYRDTCTIPYTELEYQLPSYTSPAIGCRVRNTPHE